MSIVHRLLHAGEGKKRKLLESLVPMVNEHEAASERLSDAELGHRTVEFRERLAHGEELDELIPEGFATVREAARRVLGQRHYDVQLMGGAALHFGWISEMKTGEGKTLVSTLPAYLNGLTSKGVHLVTVNDYLASRDAEWMGGVHRFLGLSVGLIQTSDDPWTRRPAYAADITYGTNNEFGFDYLRDNMSMDPDERVQRGHAFAIVDEVDSILIDEARTPLIISGRVSESARWYQTFARIVPKLVRDDDYEVDEKKRIVAVNESGITKVEEALGVENLYDNVHSDLVHHLTAALKAEELFKREVEYIVRNGEVLIVDEFTGRILDGRRYSEGLHQAIEAKEGVRVKEENQTLATITLQNYFRLYDKLAGMTGTAETEAAEFKHTYKLEVVSIPTHRTMIRDDESDLVYKTADAKWAALIEDIRERNEAGQPILVGTVSIERNEHLAKLLTRAGVKHQLLNAKQHEREASVIAQAGRKGSVTVATNMAGRGVDIILGGNPEHIALEEMRKREIGLDEDPELFQKIREEKDTECRAEREDVLGLGGLYVIGTERHESRRIDNQLRGRSGRQGDPGESRFYLSLEDDLMRLFAADTIANIMTRLKVPDDVPIEAKIVSKAIERAQKQVEERNFEIRKNILKYDEVMTKQREVIYKRRQQILDGEDMHQDALDAITEALGRSVRAVVGETYPEEWDLDEIRAALLEVYPCRLADGDFEELRATGVEGVLDAVVEDALDLYAAREAELGEGLLRDLERQVMLSILDNKWREHLYDMDYLEEGINLRAFAGTDPLVAYQAEGYDLFGEMLQMIDDEFARYMYRVQVVEEQAPRPKAVQAQHTLSSGAQEEAATAHKQVRSHKAGRNAPCPCGSGRKTKLCHPEYAN